MGKRLIIPGADFSANAIDSQLEYNLYQGYASAGGTEQIPKVSFGVLSTRVRTGELFGSYTIKTASGFAIRAIVTYSPSITIADDQDTPIAVDSRVNVSDVQGLTEYTLANPGAYSIITFCKTDATQDLSPTDNIIAELY